MIKVAFARGKYLNNAEGQNFVFDKKEINIIGISSLYPINDCFPFPVIKLPSMADLNDLPILQCLPFYQKGMKYLTNRLFGDAQILFGLEKYASSFDIFDTADPHYYYSFQLAKLRAQNKIKRLLTTYCETIPFNNESVAKKRFIKRFTQKYTDHFLCHTERSKKALLKEGIADEKISVIKLGVNLNAFKPRKVKKDVKGINILFVGRLVEEKGIMDLYKSYRLMKNYNLKLKIIGDGSLKDKLLSQIREDHLENLISIDYKTYEEMPEVYQQADIFVMASKRTKTGEEQYGMVLVEAMASGLPIIAYDSGSIPEVLGNAGLLIQTGDTDKLTHAISRLRENSSLRTRLGFIARSRVELYFDAVKTARKIGSLYTNLVTQ